MSCVSLRGGIACVIGAGPDRLIFAGGDDYVFEDNSRFGPIVLNRRGDALDKQPSERSPFWEAYYSWVKQHRRVDDEGRCMWEPIPPRLVKIQRVGRHRIVLPPDAPAWDDVIAEPQWWP